MNRLHPFHRMIFPLVLVSAWALPSLCEQPITPTHKSAAPTVDASGDSSQNLNLGRKFWDQGEYQKAFQAFQESVKLAPRSAEAHNWLGVALMQRGEFPAAITEFRTAISLNPRYGRAYTNLGSGLSKSGNLAEGVKVFEKALALEPDSLAAHLNLGIALREKGDAAQALVHLRRVARAEPNNAKLQYEIGQALQQNDDLSGAVARFERSIKINPALSESYYALGLALKQQSAAARKSSATLADETDESYNRAQGAVAKGDLEGAKRELLKSIERDPNNAAEESLLGYILGQQGDLDSAINHLEHAVTLRPNSADVHYNYGAALWYSGSKAKAISELETSVGLDPAAGASYALLGLAQRETGNLEPARVDFQRALALQPPIAANYIDLGIVFLRENELDKALGQLEAGLNLPSSTPAPDWDAAITELRRVIAESPNRADAHNMLGLLTGRKGADSDQVLAEFREAVRLRPDYPEAFNNMGLVMAQNDDDQGAIAQFREAIRIAPEYAEAHANLGAALMFTDIEAAIPELEKAVSLDPASVEAQFNLAEAYGDSPSRGLEKQIEQLRRVVAMAPTFSRAHLALGKALLQDGKVDDALSQLQEAVRLDPESGESHYQYGLALARSGKQSQGTAEIQKGRQLSAADERNQNANLDISEGRAALQKGELESAAAKFGHAIRLAPDSAVAERYLGITLEKQGDTAGAIAAYRKALDLNPGDSAARQSLAGMRASDRTTTLLQPEATATDDPEKISEFEQYIRQSRFEELEQLLGSYLHERPDSSWGWYVLGYCQFARKKVGDSIQSLSKSLSLKVENGEAHKILGRDLMIIGRFDAAQTEFEQAIRYSPRSAENYFDLGKLYSLRDNWEQARKQFEAAIQLNGSYAEAINALGFVREALGDDAEAVKAYEKAIALNEQQHGTFVEAHVNLSAYYNRAGDPRKALDYAEEALDLNSKCDPAWFQKAKAQEAQGHLEDAVSSLNHATAINPRSSTYFYVLAGMYRRLGKPDDSRKALDAFTKLDKETNELERMRRQARSAGPAQSPAAHD